MKAKHIATVLLALLVMLLSSCANTKPFVDSQTYANPELTVEEKFEAAGAVKADVPFPECYYEAKDYLERLAELVENAEDYIILTTFLGSSCEGLEDFYDTLSAKAESGVDVYMIIDGVSSYDMTASAQHLFPLYYLRESGVHLVEYNALSAFSLIQPGSLIIREHRKLVVIDGRWCTIGGMNMNYISLGADNIDLQRDSMYVFDSPSLARAFVGQFVTIWNECSVEKVSADMFPIAPDRFGGIDAWLFNQGPGSDVTMAQMYASLFSSAKEEIVMLPYLAMFDDNMYQCLEDAVARGVEVKIYVPVDSREYAQAGIFYEYGNLVDAGFEVHMEYAGEETGLPLLHQKLCVVDGRYTAIGSSNINYRSMGLSHELGLVLDSEEFASASLEQLEERTAAMHILTKEEAARLKEEKGNFFLYLFSYYGG